MGAGAAMLVGVAVGRGTGPASPRTGYIVVYLVGVACDPCVDVRAARRAGNQLFLRARNYDTHICAESSVLSSAAAAGAASLTNRHSQSPIHSALGHVVGPAPHIYSAVVDFD